MKKKFLALSLLLASLPNIVFAKEYKDIDSHWAKSYIEEIDQMQLINGYQDDTFRPDENLKKSHIYKIVNRIFSLEEKDPQAFLKVDQDLWYIDELKIAAKAGYIEKDDFFQDQDISRIDFIDILGYLYGLDEKNEDYKYFTDLEKIDATSKIYVGNLLKDGIISGFEDFELKPYASITRAQASKIINLSVKKYGRTIKKSKLSISDLKKQEDIKNQINKELALNLENTIKEAENLDLKQFSQDSIINLNSKILKAKQLLNKDHSHLDLKNAIKEIEDAKKSLVYIAKDARLYIRAEDCQGRPVNASFTINKSIFNSGDSLESGNYLLEARSFSNKVVSTYINMGREDKTITITFEEDEIIENKGLKLKLGPNLSSANGNIFSKNDRVEILIQTPAGKELDYLLLNGQKKEVISDRFIFLIKEDTEIQAVFKDIEFKN